MSTGPGSETQNPSSSESLQWNETHYIVCSKFKWSLKKVSTLRFLSLKVPPAHLSVHQTTKEVFSRSNNEAMQGVQKKEIRKGPLGLAIQCAAGILYLDSRAWYRFLSYLKLLLITTCGRTMLNAQTHLTMDRGQRKACRMSLSAP